MTDHAIPQDVDDSGIDSAAAALLSAENGASFRRARRKLESRPRPDVVAALIRAMRGAANQKIFDRAAKLLAEYGGDAAAEALAAEARSQRQYPRLAIRAFSRCEHPIVVPTLLDLLATGKMKQRRSSAYALARLQTPLAVEPLARAAALDDRGFSVEACVALRSMGRPEQIARLALTAPDAAPADHLRILLALAQSPLREGFWRASPFDARRFLEKESQDPRSPVRDRARAAAEFLQMQSTLLRGLDVVHTDTLLRAASTPGSSAPDSLLRASGSNELRNLPPSPRVWSAGNALRYLAHISWSLMRLLRRSRNTP